MAKQTEHYRLTKPEPNDFYDIDVGNNNLDLIDDLIKGNEDAIDALAGPGHTTETVVGAYAMAEAAAGQVGSVDNKIGSTGDTGGSTTAGSVFAKLNVLTQKFLSVWTDVRAAKLDSLDATILSRAAQTTANDIYNNVGARNSASDASATGTVIGKLNAILGYSFAPRVVKSVQRGQSLPSGNVSGASGTMRLIASVAINYVNPNKSLLIVNTGTSPSMGYNLGAGGTSIECYYYGAANSGTATFALNWTVIEFY